MASSKRERELARMRAERQAARRAAAETRRRRQRNAVLSALAAVAVVAVVVVAVLATRGGSAKSTNTLAAATPTPTAPSGCSYKKSGAAAKPVTGLPPSSGAHRAVTATLTTNRGTVALVLDGAKAPCAVGSFAFLAEQKYFNGTPCPRLVTKGIFVLQCGDPTGTGSGGPGYSFADENLTGATYKAGTVAMANGGPGTNGSQFFLVYKDTQLPPSYTPFGRITKGLDAILKVAKGGDDGSNSAGGGKPKLRVTISKVTVA